MQPQTDLGKQDGSEGASSQQVSSDAGTKKKFDTYRERLKDMGSISTIEQFFQYFVYMKKPSEMPREIDLFFFREGEVPMWEVRSRLIICLF